MRIDYQYLYATEQIVGDSWYLLDIDLFKENYSRLLNAFQRRYSDVLIAYSYKTNYIPALCKAISDKGGYAEVVSNMEYSLAMDIGVPPSRVVVNGPCKSYANMERYLCDGALVNLDSFREIALTKQIAKCHPDKFLNVGMRCNIEIDGYATSRFGIDTSDSRFIESIEELSKTDNVELVSIQCHLPYREVSSFGSRVRKLIEVYKSTLQFCNPKYLDIGGGLGGNVSNLLSESLGLKQTTYDDYASVICSQLDTGLYGQAEKPCLMIEPGTALVADVMSYVCKIVDIKKIGNHNIAISSGSKVNYQSRTSKINMPIERIGKSIDDQIHYESIDISGYTCMEDDYICKIYKGYLNIGDYVIVKNVGSYSIVFKPPFIEPNVPVVAIINGDSRVVKESEDYEYVFKTYMKDALL